MKPWQWAVTIGMALSLVAVGCAKKQEGVDTSKLESSFASAEGESKSAVDQAVASIKAQDYSGALASLKKVADDARLTPEQQQAIQDVINQVSNRLAETADKAVQEADKALKDVQKSLPK